MFPVQQKVENCSLVKVYVLPKDYCNLLNRKEQHPLLKIFLSHYSKMSVVETKNVSTMQL